MPLINQHNHSARRKTWQRSVLFLFFWTLTFLYCLYPVKCIFATLFYVVFCALIVLIDWFDYYIKRISDEIDQLTSRVLDVTGSTNGTSHLLKQFRDVLIENAMFKCVKALYLIEISKNGLLNRAGSYFDPRMKFKFEKDVTDSDFQKLLVVPVAMSPNNLFGIKTNCKGFFFERENIKYLFVVVISNDGNFGMITLLFLWQLLNKSVPNVIRLYRRRLEERESEKRMMEDLVKNSQYIASVRAAAHYIRNNINPFLTVSEMLTAFLIDETSVTREELETVNKKLEVKQRHILEYVTKILDSPRKDVFAEEARIYKGSSVLKMLMLTIEENTEDKIDIEFYFDGIDLESVEYMLKRQNFSVLLENLVRNATKHSDGLPVVKCFLQRNGFRIQICNRFKLACLGSVQQYIGDLTSSSKEEILKRKGEGLLLIRNTCENLSAGIKAVLSPTNEVVITITLGDYNE